MTNILSQRGLSHLPPDPAEAATIHGLIHSSFRVVLSDQRQGLTSAYMGAPPKGHNRAPLTSLTSSTSTGRSQQGRDLTGANPTPWGQPQLGSSYPVGVANPHSQSA